MRSLVLGVVTALPGLGLVAAAHAAAPPPPESNANCYGSVSPAPAPGEPNLLGYRFQCDHRITAYTIVVNRNRDYNTIDDFDVAPSVILPDGTTPDVTTAWTCEGSTPGESFNCNTGGGTTYMGALSYAVGTVDPTAPYCKFLTPGAKPGTPAQPQAFVQLIVSDSSGAQDGPFRLQYTKTCPAVPNRTPAKKQHATQHKAKSAHAHVSGRNRSK